MSLTSWGHRRGRRLASTKSARSTTKASGCRGAEPARRRDSCGLLEGPDRQQGVTIAGVHRGLAGAGFAAQRCDAFGKEPGLEVDESRSSPRATSSPARSVRRSPDGGHVPGLGRGPSSSCGTNPGQVSRADSGDSSRTASAQVCRTDFGEIASIAPQGRSQWSAVPVDHHRPCCAHGAHGVRDGRASLFAAARPLSAQHLSHHRRLSASGAKASNPRHRARNALFRLPYRACRQPVGGLLYRCGYSLRGARVQGAHNIPSTPGGLSPRGRPPRGAGDCSGTRRRCASVSPCDAFRLRIESPNLAPALGDARTLL